MARLVEYVDPANRSDAAYDVQVARCIFLRRVESVAPGVLSDLRGTMLPCFTAAKEQGCTAAMLNAALAGEAAMLSVDEWPQLADVMESYTAWGDRQHLPEPWLRPVLLTTLNAWYQVPKLATAVPLRFPVLNVTFWVEAPSEEPCPPYRPSEETAEAFAARTAAWVRRNQQAAGKRAKRRRLALAPNVLRRVGGPVQHFDWLVRHKVLGVSYATIGLEESLDDSVVRKAISALAKLIGVQLRRK